MIQTLLVLLIGVFLGGCSQTLRLYTFDTNPYTPTHSSKSSHRTLTIEYPTLMDGSNTKEMLYAYSKLERGVYQKAQWNESKTRMLMGYLQGAILEGGKFGAVRGYDWGGRSDYSLQSHIHQFYHKAYGGESVSVVSISFDLMSPRHSRPIKSRMFHYEVPTKSFDAHGYVEATKRGLDLLSNDLNHWLPR